MKSTWRQIDTQAITPGLHHSLVYNRALFIKYQQAQRAAQNDQALSLVCREVPVRRDISGRLQPYRHAVAGFFHFMEIVVLTPTRIGGRFGGQLSKQRLVEKSGLAHGVRAL